MTTREPVEAPQDALEVTEPAVADKDTGGGLRKQLEASLGREKQLRTTILTDAYKKLELDTNTGLGKAIAKEYEGEASFEALSDYAENEYGYKAPEVEPDAHPQAQQIAQEQTRADQISETAGSVAPPTQQEALAKAEAEGDYKTSMAIKSQQVAEMFR